MQPAAEEARGSTRAGDPARKMLQCLFEIKSRL